MTLNNFSIVFPGQGSQYPGMLNQYINDLPLFESTFKKSSELLGKDLIGLLKDGNKEDLSLTEITQPLMLTSNVALWNQISSLIKKPICLAGHSLGEYAALVAAEVLVFEDALNLVIERSRLMQSAVPSGEGGIAAIIGLNEKNIEDICSKISLDPDYLVSPANLNSKNQIVISGTKEGIARAIEECKSSGAKRAIALPMSVPAHCELMKDAADKFSYVLEKVRFSDPKIPVIHNVDSLIEANPEKIKIKLIEQIYKPVRWLDTINSMLKMKVNTIIECGPSKVLCGLIKRISPETETIDLDSFDNYINLSNEKRA